MWSNGVIPSELEGGTVLRAPEFSKIGRPKKKKKRSFQKIAKRKKKKGLSTF